MTESSLRQLDDLAGRLKLHRQSDNAPLVVVEGESDRRFCEDVLASLGATYFVAGTRLEALRAAEGLRVLGVPRALAVVDRDFDDDVAVVEAQGTPIVAYDGADLEAMLFASPAFQRLIESIASNEKLRAAGGANDVRSQAWEATAPVGSLRRANAIHGWGLNFDGCPLHKKIHIRTLELALDAFVNALVDVSQTTVGRGDVFAAARSPVAICSVSGLRLIRGKDLMCYVAVALRAVLAGLTQQAANPLLLAGTLRASIRESDIAGTRWYAEVHRLAS